MSELRWRSTCNDPPADEQSCLTESKHGLIQGYWNAKEKWFEGYYWRDMNWFAGRWMPIEEVKP